MTSLTAHAAGQLPAGIQWPASAAVGGHVLLMGGLDQAIRIEPKDGPEGAVGRG